MDKFFKLDFVNKPNNLHLTNGSKIGLYFGSFDPFHNDHLEVTEIMLL